MAFARCVLRSIRSKRICSLGSPVRLDLSPMIAIIDLPISKRILNLRRVYLAIRVSFRPTNRILENLILNRSGDMLELSKAAFGGLKALNFKVNLWGPSSSFGAAPLRPQASRLGTEHRICHCEMQTFTAIESRSVSEPACACSPGAHPDEIARWGECKQSNEMNWLIGET